MSYSKLLVYIGQSPRECSLFDRARNSAPDCQGMEQGGLLSMIATFD